MGPAVLRRKNVPIMKKKARGLHNERVEQAVTRD